MRFRIDNQSLIYSKFWQSVLMVVGGAAIGLSAPGMLDLVVSLGHYIPQKDLATDYLTAVVWAFLLGVGILFWPVPSRHKPDLLWAWSVKCLVTLGFMLLYESYYGSLDALGYFHLSRDSGFVWEGLVMGAGSQNIVSLAWLHQQILPDSYHAMKVTFSMVGLVAIYLFYRAAVVFLGQEKKRLFYLLALFPSILFWSSILGKDPITLLGISLYTYGVVQWYSTGRIRSLWIVALGVFVAMLIRIWLGPILLAPLFIFVVKRIRGLVPKIIFTFLVIVGFILLLNPLMENFRIETTQDLLETTNFIAKSWASGGSGQEIQVDLTQLKGVVAFIPIGAFTALFRPLPGEILNPFGLLSGIENLTLLVLFCLAVYRVRLRELSDPLVLWAVLLVLTWASIYGFISYQNLGSAVRFKLQILPILLSLCLYLGRRRQRRGPISSVVNIQHHPKH